jgi:hypothetical protein
MSSSVGVNTHALVRGTCLSAQHSRNGSKRRVRTRATEVVEEDAKISASVQDVKRELLAAAAASGRGEAASSIQKDEIRNLSSKLIAMNPTESPVTSACINGTLGTALFVEFCVSIVTILLGCRQASRSTG